MRQGEFKLYNTNKLLWWYEGADGFKTGWTNEAKYCLTATAKRDGLRLVGAVMASPKQHGNHRDMMKLFNYGFAKDAYKSFFSRGSVCGVVTVNHIYAGAHPEWAVNFTAKAAGLDMAHTAGW